MNKKQLKIGNVIVIVTVPDADCRRFEGALEKLFKEVVDNDKPHATSKRST